MKNKGFSLVEIIIGISLIGIISVFTFSIISFSLNGFSAVREKNTMIHIGEMVIEKLKINDPYIIEIIEDVEEYGQSYYLEEDFDRDKYSVLITKKYSSEGHIEVIVKVILLNQGKDIYVEFKAAISKQERI
ncbi:prepilin-type N-terminal cleavage/methylation domain-containing protein [Tissierella sp. Yu-01]|uniref:prepilin-type N-terminal cleavage/methylation domain-containing protein n=1 Tax=Tissierella sp. Yu-01 TaxID=3035694 RepID=UPI00240CEB04|nr:prepilin-type N-terminal cleavage/methylation domain-containing protein [Tissierella sp. Yu-01]WFA09682.1 prepilin-type N-terminal cleavage/methylation domain-containing protein [Tissierella sp. Yu-01]